MTAIARWLARQAEVRAATRNSSPYISTWAQAENEKRIEEAIRAAWFALPQTERDAVNAEREAAHAAERAARNAHNALVASALKAYRAANSPTDVSFPCDYMSADRLGRIERACRARLQPQGAA